MTDVSTPAHGPAANDPGPPVDDPSRGSGRRLLRLGLFALSAILVAAAALLVPMPLVLSAPGTAFSVADMVTVDAPTTELNGDLGLLTVWVDQPSLVEIVVAMLDDEQELTRRDDVIPPTLDHRAYVELQQEEFRRSFRVAVAVGMQAAGLDARLRTAPQVVAVVPDGPAAPHLRPGDVIRRYRGAAVSTIEEILGRSDDIEVGTELPLTVERDGERVDVTVTAAEVIGLDRPGMGITLQTMEWDIELPFEVTLSDQRGIGGPSAGLMMAVTVYDLLAEEDLVAGRSIVGTGTVDGDGRVGPIGSVREKVRTAITDGAEVMLVPVSQAEAARAEADGRIEVVGVATVKDALDALRR